VKSSQLKHSTVVITGASSGVGRAMALAFAERGARLVLAARREPLLRELARECETLGAEVLVLKTDVTDFTQLNRLFQSSLERFGKIDIWINNAGVGAVGAFDLTPLQAHEQVLKTNLLAPLQSSHLVLAHFKARGSGMIINMNSTGAWVPAPFAVSYSVSKFGLNGLGLALNSELKEYPEIQVCNVYPAFLDTPAFEHAANFTGKALRVPPPVYNPYKVAEKVIHLVLHPRARLLVGSASRMANLFQLLSPALSGRLVFALARRYFAQASKAPISEGSLFKPLKQGQGVLGGWRQYWLMRLSRVMSSKPFLQQGDSV
jgi:short-subunit dehydrogenase